MGQYKNAIGRHITGERRKELILRHKNRDQPRDNKEIKEKVWSGQMYHCNSCCKEVPIEQCIKYIFRDDTYKFCDDKCLAYYMGEFYE